MFCITGEKINESNKSESFKSLGIEEGSCLSEHTIEIINIADN